MKEDFYILLLYKQLNGEISQEEKELLQKWRKSSEKNELEARSVALAWQASAPVTANTEGVNKDDEFDLLLGKIAEDENNNDVNRLVSIHKQTNKRRPWMAIAAAVLVLLGVAAFLNRSSELEVEWVEVVTTQEKQSVLLADGSEIQLNENSQLSYPVSFVGKERRVSLRGEAFFEITPNAGQPFVVETEKEEIRVLGTSFNVEAYQKDKSTSVYVVTGKVQFSSKVSQAKTILLPEQGASFDHDTGVLNENIQASKNSVSWMTQQLFFEEKPLFDILVEIENEFNILFKLNNPILENCTLDTSFDAKQVDLFLEDISNVFGANIEKKNDQEYEINGGSCQ